MANNKIYHPFAPVQFAPVAIGGREVANKLGVTVEVEEIDKDGNSTTVEESVGIVGTNYGLITNEKAVQVAEDIIHGSQYSFSPLRAQSKKDDPLGHICFNGKQFTANYLSDDAGDGEIRTGIQLRNSYDGSARFGIRIFACRLECSNQFHSGNLFGSFLVSHTQKADFNIHAAIDDLGHGADRVIASLPKFYALKDRELEAKHILSAKETVKSISTSKWGEVISKIEELSLWGLYNALTWVSTHDLAPSAGYNASAEATDWLIPSSNVSIHD